MKERKLVKEAVICSECGEETAPAQYVELFTCDFCGADFYDKDATPLGVMRVMLIGDSVMDRQTKVSQLHFDKPECIADYIKELTRGTLQLPWLSPYQWKLFAAWLRKDDEVAAKLELLETIDKQTTHQQKQDQTDYVRGFVKGIQWAATEIEKVFKL